jgi:hypothetical protein
MNKQSPEYIRVREEFAKKLASFDNWNWEGLDKETVRFNQGNTQQTYLGRADSILEIKGIAVLADEQELPHFFVGFVKVVK